MKQERAIAVFGGGCFWCTEAIFRELKGVISVTPGYAGGTAPHPTYEEVCGGETGHAEVIRIEFDPARIRYRDLLTVFFAAHDPTTPNRQGNDVGTQYRSIILFANNQQEKEARAFIKDLNERGTGGAPVVTEVAPLEKFYEAEAYHREYYAHNKDKPYCQLVINPKLSLLQEKFAALIDAPEKKSADHPPGDGLPPTPATKEEWRRALTPEQYRIMREGGTEAPFSGKLLHEKGEGVYRCAACGNPLFSSDAKFDSGTGWPSFDQALPGAVREIPDTSAGMRRTEIVCSRCGSHLGHLFTDGPTPTGERYCMNSVCLDLAKKQDE